MFIRREAVAIAAVAAGALLASSTPVQARQQGRFQIDMPQSIAPLAEYPQTLPAITIFTPTGFGAAWGDFFMGAALVNRQRTYRSDRDALDNVDGAAAVGLGIGNPFRNVGVELSLLSFSTARRGFFTRGSFNAKLHRIVQRNFSIAVGAISLLGWGEVDQYISVYGVASKVWDQLDGLPFPIAITAGVGNGVFRMVETDPGFVADDHFEFKGSVGVFGALALQFVDPVAVIGEWTGQDLNVGLSIVPFRSFPLTINPAVLDLAGTGALEDSALASGMESGGPRFMLSLGIGMRRSNFAIFAP